MPLKLSLKPGEAVIVNGAVMRNGDRRGSILVRNLARVMREKDIVHPEEVKAPAERAYFAIMQMYLTGEIEGPLYEQAISALTDGMRAARGDDETRRKILDITGACAAGETYQALALCRKYMVAHKAHQGDVNG